MTYASATAMAWDLAGQPRRDSLPVSLLPGRCAVCGTDAEETVPAKATVGAASFTSRDLLAYPRSDVTCYPCAWALAGRPPHALRTWTVACAPGRDLGPSSVKAVPCSPVLGCAVSFSGWLLLTGPGQGALSAVEAADAALLDARLRRAGLERAAADGFPDGAWALTGPARH